MSPDGLLPEIVEIPDHPWFIGVQFHPELKSRPFEPHPLFTSFVKAAVDQSRLVYREGAVLSETIIDANPTGGGAGRRTASLLPSRSTRELQELGDWRGEMLSRLRALVREADPKSLRNGSGEGCRCGRMRH